MLATSQAPAPVTPFRFTVKDYMALGELGILGPNDRTELIDGQIIHMSPIGVLHARIVNRLNRWLVRRAGDDAIVAVQNPIILDLHGMPQPDFVLLAAEYGFDAPEHAGPGDILLVIEVSDTSLRFDRETKLKHYARAGIVEYWVVDVNAEEMWVHRKPKRSGRYAETLSLGAKPVACEALPAVKVSRSDLGWKTS